MTMATKDQLAGRYVLTVCMDGRVSILDKEEKKVKQRRLNSALPAYAVEDIFDAFELIRRVCVLTRTAHGGKTGTLIEPMVIGWPLHGDATLDHLDIATRNFANAHRAMQGERAAANRETAAVKKRATASKASEA